MKVTITTYLYCAPTTDITIPDIKSWDEIKDWFVKWDVLHYTLDGEMWLELALDNADEDAVDWKRPNAVVIVDPKTGFTLEDTSEKGWELI